MIRYPHSLRLGPPPGRSTILPPLALCLLLAGCTPETPGPAQTQPVLENLPAGNVEWLSWEEATGGGASGGSPRPVFLFTYTRRSYWCRDLFDRCFDDPLLGRELERIALPVRVDADLRPDIAARYGMGGWPSLTVLFPDGDIVTGTTYIDPDDLEELLRRIDVLFSVSDRQGDLERDRRRLQEKVAAAAARTGDPAPPTDGLLAALVDSMQSAARAGEPLSPEALLFLLEFGRIAGRDDIVEMALEHVDAPPADEDGLLVRASLTSDGRLRDEEKTLTINARWLRVFAAAGRTGHHPSFQDRSGRLAAAIRNRLGTVGSPLLAAGYSGFGIRADSTLTLLPAPGVRAQMDTVAITAWNGLAASGLSSAGGSDNRDAAASILKELMGRRTADGLLPRAAGARPPYHLEDQACAALAALDLAAAGERVTKAEAFAAALADAMIDRFCNTSGAFSDLWPVDGRTHLPALDYEMPGVAGLAAQLFVRVGARTSAPVFRDAAARLLTTHLNPNMARPGQLGSIGRALLAYLHTTEWTALQTTPSPPQTARGKTPL